MRIGCQHHHVDDWDKFTDDEISKMDDDALEFWRANKGKLITIANITIANSTKEYKYLNIKKGSSYET